jgi:hypothetical protein
MRAKTILKGHLKRLPGEEVTLYGEVEVPSLSIGRRLNMMGKLTCPTVMTSNGIEIVDIVVVGIEELNHGQERFPHSGIGEQD